MQTDARVLLNLAAEERQQLRSQGSRYIPGQKNFLGKFPTEFVRERGAARRACSSRIHIPHATCPRASPDSRQVCFVSVSILVSRAGLRFPSRVWPPLYFATLASSTASFSAFSLTPSPTPTSPFLPPVGFIPLSIASTVPRYFRIGEKASRVGCSVKERDGGK